MSERVLVRKVLVDAIEPIEGADRIEVARIGGWRVVVAKGEFKEGQIGLFFEVDSALNPHDDRYAFLKERCYKKFNVAGKLFDECLRIRTIRLKGIYSQGVLLDPSLFCEVRNMKLGEDCTALLAVRHYDEVAEKAVRMSEKTVPGNAKGLFPSFVPKSDEPRIQNITKEDMERFKDLPLYVTEKKDGTSTTIFYTPSMRPDDPFGVCSRNLELKDEGGGVYWEMAHKYNLPETLPAWCQRNEREIAIQAETIGEGVSGNRDMLAERRMEVFRIWDILEQRWVAEEERHKICEELNLEHVPTLGVKTLTEFDCDYDKILKFAEGYTENGNEREGVVFKSTDGVIHFKAVSNRYLAALK